MEISQEDFLSIRDFIKQKTGIFFDEKKKYFVDMRVDKRMKELNCESPVEYIRILRFGLRNGEVDAFINTLTTNETYFFRDLPQLQTFSDEVLPQLILKKKDSNRSLRIWSAGCSSGEEPYTIAMLILQKLVEKERWNIEILATDIDRDALADCRKGIYSTRSIKDVPPQFLLSYFSYAGGSFMIKPEIKRMVNFGYLNLIDKAKMATVSNIDLIFCRNVLIYFDTESARQVVNNFFDSLVSGGYIFLGHSESMSRLSAAFRLIRLKNGIVYMKE